LFFSELHQPARAAYAERKQPPGTFIRLIVEREFGGHISLIVFLALYALVLWAAWLFAVWMTAPRHVAEVRREARPQRLRLTSG